mmetsp:Transcript_41343/g.43254  ORF Transcript_41343/g.43254 Transcript_41343/m.43254 type:complete len:494 (-) Transcript_41343:231-1712(-)
MKEDKLLNSLEKFIEDQFVLVLQSRLLESELDKAFIKEELEQLFLEEYSNVHSSYCNDIHYTLEFYVRNKAKIAIEKWRFSLKPGVFNSYWEEGRKMDEGSSISKGLDNQLSKFKQTLNLLLEEKTKQSKYQEGKESNSNSLFSLDYKILTSTSLSPSTKHSNKELISYSSNYSKNKSLSRSNYNTDRREIIPEIFSFELENLEKGNLEALLKDEFESNYFSNSKDKGDCYVEQGLKKQKPSTAVNKESTGSNQVVVHRARFLSEDNCNHPSYQVRNFQNMILQEDYLTSPSTQGELNYNTEEKKSSINKKHFNTDPQYSITGSFGIMKEEYLDSIDIPQSSNKTPLHPPKIHTITETTNKNNVHTNSKEINIIEVDYFNNKQKEPDPNSRKSTDIKSQLKSKRENQELDFLPEEEISNASFELNFESANEDDGEEPNIEDNDEDYAECMLSHAPKEQTNKSKNPRNFNINEMLNKAADLKRKLSVKTSSDSN